MFGCFAAVCAPGETLESCAYKCGDLCDNMASLLDNCRHNSDCVPMCRSGSFGCGAGEKLKDKTTCVPESMCPCRKPDGTIAKVC